MANQVAWFVVFPASESETSATEIPPGSKIVNAEVGSAAYNAWLGNGAFNGWQVLSGPFTSEAAARAWSPAPLTASDWVAAGVAGVVIGAGNEPDASTALAVGKSAASTLTGINAIGDFFQRLTQSHTWIRVAEVLLGLGLIVVGLAKLSSGSAVGKAAVKAGKAAAIL